MFKQTKYISNKQISLLLTELLRLSTKGVAIINKSNGKLLYFQEKPTCATLLLNFFNSLLIICDPLEFVLSKPIH